MAFFYKKLFLLSSALRPVLILILLINSRASFEQQTQVDKIHLSPPTGALKFSSAVYDDLFGTRAAFIENIGQYGDVMPGHTDMDEIKFRYEGLAMLVLFTQRGLIHLQRKVEGPSEQEREKQERKGVKQEHEMEDKKAIDRTITMEWIDANANPEIVARTWRKDITPMVNCKVKQADLKELFIRNCIRV